MRPRVAVAGNQWITLLLLRMMHKAGRQVDLVINLGPEHSDGIAGYQDLAATASSIGAEMFRPQDYALSSEDDRQALTAQPIDALIAFGWQRLIPEWLLSHCARGAYGVHGGPKPPPRCRGQAVFNWALLLGCEEFFLYMFKLTPRADDGKIVEMVRFDLLPHDDIASVYHKNCVASSRLFIDNLPAILDGSVTLSDQPAGEPSVLPRRRPEQGGIDWAQPAHRIANLARAVAPPYPGAFTELNGARVFIQTAHVFDTHLRFDAPPGTVLDVFPNGHFTVMTGDHALYVRDAHGAPENLSPGVAFQRVSGEQPPDPVL